MNFSLNLSNQSFQARVKLTPANKEKIIKSIGTSVVCSSGAMSIMYGIDSMALASDRAPVFSDNNVSIQDATSNFFHSQVAENGIPMQSSLSTSLPASLISLGSALCQSPFENKANKNIPD